MDLDTYWTRANLLARSENLRYGQVLFTLLQVVRPYLAQQVTGTTADPYYANSPDSATIRAYSTFLKENW